jgi:capsular exopolysaccharide synthesis family protein
MSEIFSFLKKAEAERSQLPVEITQADSLAQQQSERPANLTNMKTQPQPDENTETSLIATDSKPVEADIVGNTQFDLASADRPIQNVLDPLTIFGEQFRILRSKLNLMQKQRGIKTILVTSTVPQEGKTFVACGLAGVIAQEPGKRIVLIDADMRKPRSGEGLGINGESKKNGLSQVLRGTNKFHESLLSFANLEFCFLPSGPIPANPSELLGTPIMEQLLQSAKETFDWIVIDSPPVLGLADSTLIAPLCDAVVLVVRADSTPTKLILDTIQKIGRERICGIVMNRQHSHHASRYYYSYYYHSYHSSKKD